MMINNKGRLTMPLLDEEAIETLRNTSYKKVESNITDSEFKSNYDAITLKK